MNMMKRLLLTLALLASSPALGQNFSVVPYQFVDGTPFKTSQMMADFVAVTNQGNVAVNTLQNRLSALSPFPPGAIVMFYLQACPTGWTGMNTPGTLDGYYIRGTDNGRGLDTTGTALGGTEVSTIQSHVHSATGTWLATTSNMAGVTCTAACGGAVPVITSMATTGGNFFTSAASGSGTNSVPDSMGLLPCRKN